MDCYDKFCYKYNVVIVCFLSIFIFAVTRGRTSLQVSFHYAKTMARCFGNYSSNKVSSNQIDDASGSIEFSKLFHDKYRLLYSSVPTDTKELDHLDDLHNDINNGITPNDHVMMTPAIIRQC